MHEPASATPHLAAPRRQVLQEPTLPFLLLALVAMLRRGYLPDTLLVGGTAALVLVDSRRWTFRVSSAEPAAGAPNRAARATALAVAAVGMSSLARTSGWLDAAFALVGLAMLATAWLPGGAAPAGRAPLTPGRWWVWPTLGVGVALIELWSWLHQPAPRIDSPAHPTVSTLVEPGLSSWPVRAVVLWLWLLGCWWLLRRVRAWSS